MQKSPLFLIHFFRELFLGWDQEKEKGRGGTSRPCLRGTVERATHECCRVGRANNSNAFGQFFEQESQRYLTFTMIRTPSSYGRARGVSNFNMMMGMESRSTTGVFVVRDNTYISNSNVSMRVFGSTGEPDGRGEGIWDGGLVVSL